MTSDSLIVQAPDLATDYHIFIQPPRNSRPAPLVLVLDGDDQFTYAAAAARDLEDSGTIPPLFLAGIGYGGSYRSKVNRRVRDYTPTQPTDEPMQCGGADRFLAFLENKLIDELATVHPIVPKAIGVTGHSLGSLFGLHALFQQVGRISRFLLSSPSIWWDDRVVLKSASTNKAVHRPSHAFLSVGELDTPSMTGDLTLLEEELDLHPRKNLSFTVRRFADRDHYNVLPDAFRTGLAWLYGNADSSVTHES